MVRATVQARDFLTTVSELTGAHGIHLSVKGQLFEGGNKPQPGVKRLHLLCEAQSRQDAINAAREIRRNIEEVV